MNILLLTPIYPPTVGGPATYAREISERLTPKHGVTIIAYAEDGAIPYGNATLIPINKNASLPVRLVRFFFASLRASRHADVIYAQNAVAAGLPAILVGKLRKKPVIIKVVGVEAWERATQHGMTKKRVEDFLSNPEGSVRVRMLIALEGWVLRRAHMVTTPSQYLGEALIRGHHLKAERCKTNFNATEIRSYDEPPKPHSILVTARLTAWKGIDGVIRALTIVHKKFPDASLIIAGDGPERQRLEALTHECGLTQSVTFLGTVPHDDIWKLRKQTDVFALNSTYEGLPHSVLDSFAARRPVVATNVSGTNEVVEHGVNGLLVQPGNDKDLANALIQIFSDHALRTRLIEEGTRTITEKFSWERHLSRLEELFATVSTP